MFKTPPEGSRKTNSTDSLTVGAFRKLLRKRIPPGRFILQVLDIKRQDKLIIFRLSDGESFENCAMKHSETLSSIGQYDLVSCNTLVAPNGRLNFTSIEKQKSGLNNMIGFPQKLSRKPSPPPKILNIPDENSTSDDQLGTPPRPIAPLSSLASLVTPSPPPTNASSSSSAGVRHSSPDPSPVPRTKFKISRSGTKSPATTASITPATSSATISATTTTQARTPTPAPVPVPDPAHLPSKPQSQSFSTRATTTAVSSSPTHDTPTPIAASLSTRFSTSVPHSTASCSTAANPALQREEKPIIRPPLRIASLLHLAKSDTDTKTLFDATNVIVSEQPLRQSILEELRVKWSPPCEYCKEKHNEWDDPTGEQCQNRFLVQLPSYRDVCTIPPKCSPPLRGKLIVKLRDQQDSRNPVILLMAFTIANSFSGRQLANRCKIYRIFTPDALDDYFGVEKLENFSPFWEVPEFLPNGEPFELWMLFEDHPSVSGYRLKTQCRSARQTRLEFEDMNGARPDQPYMTIARRPKDPSAAVQELVCDLQTEFHWPYDYIHPTEAMLESDTEFQKRIQELAQKVPNLRLSVLQDMMSFNQAQFDKLKERFIKPWRPIPRHRIIVLKEPPPPVEPPKSQNDEDEDEESQVYHPPPEKPYDPHGMSYDPPSSGSPSSSTSTMSNRMQNTNVTTTACTPAVAAPLMILQQNNDGDTSKKRKEGLQQSTESASKRMRSDKNNDREEENDDDTEADVLESEGSGVESMDIAGNVFLHSYDGPKNPDSDILFAESSTRAKAAYVNTVAAYEKVLKNGGKTPCVKCKQELSLKPLEELRIVCVGCCRLIHPEHSEISADVMPLPGDCACESFYKESNISNFGSDSYKCRTCKSGDPECKFAEKSLVHILSVAIWNYVQVQKRTEPVMVDEIEKFIHVNWERLATGRNPPEGFSATIKRMLTASAHKTLWRRRRAKNAKYELELHDFSVPWQIDVSKLPRSRSAIPHSYPPLPKAKPVASGTALRAARAASASTPVPKNPTTPLATTTNAASTPPVVEPPPSSNGTTSPPSPVAKQAAQQTTAVTGHQGTFLVPGNPVKPPLFSATSAYPKSVTQFHLFMAAKDKELGEKLVAIEALKLTHSKTEKELTACKATIEQQAQKISTLESELATRRDLATTPTGTLQLEILELKKEIAAKNAELAERDLKLQAAEQEKIKDQNIIGLLRQLNRAYEEKAGLTNNTNTNTTSNSIGAEKITPLHPNPLPPLSPPAVPPSAAHSKSTNQ